MDKIGRRIDRRDLASEALGVLNEAIELAQDRIVSDDVLALMWDSHYYLMRVVKRNIKLNEIDLAKAKKLMESLDPDDVPF
jgi:hypothetical protein